MNKGEFLRAMDKRKFKRGDRILVVLRNGDVDPVLFVGLEEGNDEQVDLKMHWIFDGGGVSERLLMTECPFFVLNNVDAILPARNIEELTKLYAKLLKFSIKTKIILEEFLREILT